MSNNDKAPQDKRANMEEKLSRHARAVDDLIHADVTNSPAVDPDELRKYRSGFKLKLPAWLKAALIKVWFGGMICYFFVWGLGPYGVSTLDTVVVMGVVHGIVTDLIVNNIFRYYARKPGENDCWMMVPKRRFISLLLNLVYSLILMFLVLLTYGGVNKGPIFVGVGPILFGVFTAAWDMLFLGCKRLIRRIVGDAMEKAGPKPRKRDPNDFWLK